MKKLQLSLMALFVTAVTMNAQLVWNCGQPATTGGTDYTSSVQAKRGYDSNTGKFFLHIYGSGYMADFEASGSKTTAPWDTCATCGFASGIDSVIIENGVYSIGKYAFKSFFNMTSLVLPNSMLEIHENALYPYWGTPSTTTTGIGGHMYCSALTAPTCTISTATSPPTYPQHVLLHLPNAEAVTAYSGQSPIWSDFAQNGHIIADNAAASVVVLPKDSIFATRVVIKFELVGANEADKLKHTYKLTIANKDDATDKREINVKYDAVDSKWVIANGMPLPAHRMPVLKKDTVVRSTESLQIDITNLKPNSSYNYSVTGFNGGGDVVLERTGDFLTPQKTSTDMVVIEVSEREGVRTRYYNLLGQPVDESYRGIIVTDKGEKLLPPKP